MKNNKAIKKKKKKTATEIGGKISLRGGVLESREERLSWRKD